MLRPLLKAIALAALITITAFPASGNTHTPDLILPGVGMGPVKLGMTRAAAEAARRGMVCGYAVSIRYDAAGRASRIETNCGGALQTPEGVQAGGAMSEVLAAYGKPAPVVQDEVYEHGVAYWFNYPSGIGFRAVVFGPTPDHTVITTIAVWKPSPATRP
jgi:hypothetical protein